MLSSSRKIAIQQVDKVVDLVLRCNCEIAFHTVLLVHRVSYRSSAAKHASHRRASLRSPVSPRTHRAVAFGWRCAYASHRRVPFVLGNVRCARLVSMHTTYHRRLVRFVPHRLPTDKTATQRVRHVRFGTKICGLHDGMKVGDRRFSG